MAGWRLLRKQKKMPDALTVLPALSLSQPVSLESLRTVAEIAERAQRNREANALRCLFVTRDCGVWI